MSELPVDRQTMEVDIACVGFGPGHEDQAHAPNELTWKSELVQAAAMYAVIPQAYLAGC